MGSSNVLPLDPLPRPVRLLGTLRLVVLLAGVVVAGSWVALTLGGTLCPTPPLAVTFT